MTVASSLDICICTALRQAARHVSQHYDAALAPMGVSVNQYAILVRLQRLGPSPIQALARNLVMDRSTLGHLLRPLEKRNLVNLGHAADDRRRRALALTAAGKDLVAAARPLWAGAQRRFEAVYGTDLCADLGRVLGQVAHIDLGVAEAPPSA